MIERGLVVGTRAVGAVDGLLEREIRIRQLGDVQVERERLAERQPDCTRQLQLGLVKIVGGGGRPLRLRVQLHFGAQDVDAGDETALFKVDRLPVERLRRFLLGPRRLGARQRGEGLNVEIGGDMNDEVAGAMVGASRRVDIV